MSYELRQELHGHSGDVRCACVLASDGVTLVTGSRDRSVRMWKLAENGEYEPGVANFDHPHWVNAMESLSKSRGGFATGCHDHLVRIFDDACNMLASLGGHSGPVSSLSAFEDGERLASGSWDGSARVWDLASKTCMRVLGNHENMVCVLTLSNGFLATGSTGMQQGNAVVGFKIRLFGPERNEPVTEMQPHEGPIRCLSRVNNNPRFSFVSASNDGSVVLYSLDGGFINKLVNPPGFEGTPAFNFCVQSVRNAAEEDSIVTASDDCCARIWNCSSGQILQEIEHPSTVWWVISLPNGDLCTCSGDGVVRLFSTEDMRKCSDDSIIAAFKQTATASREAQKKKVSPPIDVSTLANFRDAPPGASDQQVRVFNKDGVATAYQWSAPMGTWIEIGVVTGGGGDGPEGKTELDGEYFDRVVPVEIQDVRTADGQLKKLKLGFNSGDNPYVVANAFVKKNELPDYYVEEIVQFIHQQRSSGGSVPTITQQGGPSAAPRPAPVVTSPTAPGKKGSAYFPLADSIGIYFEKGNAEKAVTKIKELNTTNAVLSPRELEDLDAILNTLKATSKYHATQFTESQVQLLANKLVNSWGANDRFAAYDLMRAVLLHPDGGAKFSGKRGEQFFAQACQTGCTTGASQPLVLTCLRAACNMFRFQSSNQAALSAASDPSTCPIEVVSQSPLCKEVDGNVRQIIGTLLCNCANSVYYKKSRGDRDNAVLAQCVRGAVTLLTAHPALDDEGAFRAVCALGCTALVEPQLVRNGTSGVEACSGERVKRVWKDVQEAYQK